MPGFSLFNTTVAGMGKSLLGLLKIADLYMIKGTVCLMIHYNPGSIIIGVIINYKELIVKVGSPELLQAGQGIIQVGCPVVGTDNKRYRWLLLHLCDNTNIFDAENT